MVKHITEERKADIAAAYKLIEACEHFGINPKLIARLIGVLKPALNDKYKGVEPLEETA